MKTLLILMILLSLFVGISINGEWSFIYSFEFPSFIEMIKTGTVTQMQIVEWVILLIAHLGVLLLLFLTKEKYFQIILMFVPFAFIFMYMIVGGGAALLLIPFAVVWIIAIIKQGKMNSQIR